MNDAEKPPEYAEGAELTGVPSEEFDWTDHEHDRLDKQGQSSGQRIRVEVGAQTPDDEQTREVSLIRKSLATHPPSPRPKRRIHVQFSDTTDEAAKEYREGTGEGESQPLTEEDRLIGATAARKMVSDLELSQQQNQPDDKEKDIDDLVRLLRETDPNPKSS